MLYILCKYNESHLTRSQIPCLCKLTWPIKPDSDSDSEVEAGKRLKSLTVLQFIYKSIMGGYMGQHWFVTGQCGEGGM